MERGRQFYDSELKNSSYLGCNSNDQPTDRMYYDPLSNRLTESRGEKFRREYKRKPSPYRTGVELPPELRFKYSLRKNSATQDSNVDDDDCRYCESSPNLARARLDGYDSECDRKSSANYRIKVPTGLDLKFSISQRFTLPTSKSRLSISGGPSSSTTVMCGADCQPKSHPECNSNERMTSPTRHCRHPKSSDDEIDGCKQKMSTPIASDPRLKLTQPYKRHSMRPRCESPMKNQMRTRSPSDKIGQYRTDAEQTYRYDYMQPGSVRPMVSHVRALSPENYEPYCPLSPQVGRIARPKTSRTHLHDRIRSGSEFATSIGNQSRLRSTADEQQDYSFSISQPYSPQGHRYNMRQEPAESLAYAVYKTNDYQESMPPPMAGVPQPKSSHTHTHDRESAAAMGNRWRSFFSADENSDYRPPNVKHSCADASPTYRHDYKCPKAALPKTSRSPPMVSAVEENGLSRRSSRTIASKSQPNSSETYIYDRLNSESAPPNVNHSRPRTSTKKMTERWHQASPPMSIDSPQTTAYDCTDSDSVPPLTNHSHQKSSLTNNYAQVKTRPMSSHPTPHSPHILYYRRPEYPRPRSPHTINDDTHSGSPTNARYNRPESTDTKYYTQLKPPRMTNASIDCPNSPSMFDYNDLYAARLEDRGDSRLSLMGVSSNDCPLDADFDLSMDFLDKKYISTSIKQSKCKLHDVIDESLREMSKNVPYLADDLFQRRRMEYRKLTDQNKKQYRKQSQSERHAKKPNPGGNFRFRNGPHNAPSAQSSRFQNRDEMPNTADDYTNSPRPYTSSTSSHSSGVTRADLLTFRNDVMGKLGGMTDDFTGTIDEDVLKAKILGPMIEKLQLMYMNNVRGELALLEDLELIPAKVGEVYQCERAIKRKKEEREKKREQRRLEKANREREHREWERRSSYSAN